MSTITKEWLQQTIAEMEAARNEIPFGLDEDDSNTLAALRIALASLEAEAVGYIDAEYADLIKSGHIESCSVYSEPGEGCIELYTAPPAPTNAEPVAWLWSHRKHPSEVTLVRPEDDERAEGAHWSGWNCQALYAAPPATVSVPDEFAGKSFNYIANKFQVSTSEAQWILVGWNARSSAMLNQEKSNG